MLTNSEDIRFEVKFDGEDLTNHSINLDLFIESLSGLNGLLSEINKDQNHGNSENLNAYEIKIHIPERQNCCVYEVIINALEQIDNLQDIMEYLKNLGLIGLSTDAVINLIKKYKGNKIPCNDKNKLNPKSVVLYENKKFRMNLFKFSKPLEKKGIKILEVTYDRETVKIRKEEVTEFLENTSAELISNDSNNEETKIYKIELCPLRINFDKKTWIFKPNKGKKNYEIDITATELYKSEKNFSKKDLYSVNLEETIKKNTNGGKDTHTYKMLEILDIQKHKEGEDNQLKLDIENQK